MSKSCFVQRCPQFFLTTMLILIFFLNSTHAFAQQSVSGTVKDAEGKGLPGASITVKGTSQTVSTDAAGAFRITVPSTTSILTVSYVGYATQEVPAGTGAGLAIILQSNSSELAQVVVVGYGTQNKRDVTGAVKTLKSESFNKGIITAPQQLLQGKVSGVNVTSASGEPGAPLSITVRGPGSVRSGSTPLFVIDGLPLDNASTGGGDPLNFINPQDIESIDVLKDASATAIYGARGANGVVIITTKRGRAGVSTLAFSSSVGISKLARALPVFTADEFRMEVPKAGGTLDDKGGNTDWQKLITRTATTQNYNLNMSGGANKLSYFASLGLQKQQGIIKKNDLDRYSGRFNVTQRFLDDRLVVDLNLSVANTKQTRPPITSVIGDAITNNPTYPAYDAAGNLALYQNINNNPLLYFDLDKEFTTINRVVGNISPSLRIIKGLVYKLNFGIDHSTGNRDVEAFPSTVPLRLGRLESFYNWNRNKLVENYLTYTWSNTKHNLTALAGHSYQRVFVQQRSSSINNFTVNGVDPIYNPGVGQLLDLANNRPSGFAFINELQSFFGRVTYQFNNKYLFTANFRADGSTKFGENKRYGYFPSFSAGWKISDEEFMKNTAFDNLKLRAGWGSTGNQEITSKLTQPLFTSLASASYPLYPAAGNYPAGLTYVRLANPDLQWESSKQTDLGLDFSLWRGALSGTLDLFRKVSNNILLQTIPADPIQPANTTFSNVEDMTITNKGVEFELEYRHRSEQGIGYSVGGNFTYAKNIVENSPYTLIPSGSVSGAGITSSTINGYVNGQPIGTFYLKEYIGLDGAGMSAYTDLDKNGVINDNDRLSLGTALPKVIYSFYGNMGYKGFDFGVNFNGVSGNKIYNYTENVSFSKLRLAKNVNSTREAIADPKESLNNATPVTSRYLRDGAYLRLNNASIGYSFNVKKLGISNSISAIRLSVTGQNLFLVTKYKGYDPEVNIDRNIDSAVSYGIDYISYPKARSVIFGLNVSF